jgi:(1->4)-alpha-D-glucan 1-alpha-D-glucosylmutase
VHKDSNSGESSSARRRSRFGATYRLQLHSDFGFAKVESIAAYLAELGVTHVYLSPILQAAKGSTHGYDVVDPSRVSAELGGSRGHAALSRTLSRAGIGQILDIVPNHMSNADRANRWWWDVLAKGPKSEFGSYFDIDWKPADPELQGRVLLPVLEDRYERVLTAGKIALTYENGAFEIHYADMSFPVSPEAATALDRLVEDRDRDKFLERYNQDPALLDRVLAAQHYRLAFWRESAGRRNYRRFFDVDSLVALRMDREEVFRDTHAKVLEWLEEGTLDGVRVDHVDGLRDPEEYLSRLRAAAPDAKIFVEKILGPTETLPPTWPVTGTTGYEFLNLLEGLFVRPDGEAALSDCYARFTGNTLPFAAIAHRSRHLVMKRAFASDVQRVSRLLHELARTSREAWRFRDLPASEFDTAVSEYLACLPVYRTYMRPSGRGSSRDADAAYVAETLLAVRTRCPGLEPALVELMGRAILGRAPTEDEFRLALQETSGPIMAKGVEDTALYRYHRLLSKNEVGGDAAGFSTTLAQFHGNCQRVAKEHPETLLATATHDTKRGEDVRARLDLLSEIPDVWSAAVERWSQMTAPFLRAPVDANDAYLFYQTFVGAYPLSKSRLQQYLLKAAREAKVHTSWRNLAEGYEGALETFVDGALSSQAFMDDIGAFARALVRPGRIVSIAKKLIALTAPGVPDLYMGTELWDMNLVDPDNRRPVDFDTRQRLLAELRTLDAPSVWERADEGLPKLLVVKTALAVRRDHPDAFGVNGAYEPLFAAGPLADQVVAFARGGDVVTVAPRWVMKLHEGWRGTTLPLPPGQWLETFSRKEHSGGSVRMDSVLKDFPVALFVRSRG